MSDLPIEPCDHQCIQTHAIERISDDIAALKDISQRRSNQQVAILCTLRGLERGLEDMRAQIGSPQRHVMVDGERIEKPATGVFKVVQDLANAAISSRASSCPPEGFGDDESEVTRTYSRADLVRHHREQQAAAQKWRRAVVLASIPAVAVSLAGIAALINALMGAIK